MSEVIQDRAILTTADHWKVVVYRNNGTTPFSMTLNKP